MAALRAVAQTHSTKLTQMRAGRSLKTDFISSQRSTNEFFATRIRMGHDNTTGHCLSLPEETSTPGGHRNRPFQAAKKSHQFSQAQTNPPKLDKPRSASPSPLPAPKPVSFTETPKPHVGSVAGSLVPNVLNFQQLSVPPVPSQKRSRALRSTSLSVTRAWEFPWTFSKAMPRFPLLSATLS